MPRKTIKEISDEGLTDAQWNAAENRVRRRQVRQEALHLRKLGRIRPFAIPTPLVRSDTGHIKCVGGQRYTIGHESTFKEN